VSISVVCPVCKELTPVVDKTITEHRDCPAGGMHYVPSPRVFQAGPGAPKIEVLGAKPIQCKCGARGAELLLKVTPSKAGLN
jgi:hypothetical protein